jgi:multiple sugar transport system substrate-binding protein
MMSRKLARPFWTAVLAGACLSLSSAAAQTTVNFFHMTWIPGMIEVIDDAAAHFERENPGVRIEQTRVSWTDAPAQLMTSIMGGAAPDISQANTTMLAQFRAIGAYADVTDEMPTELRESFLPAALAVAQRPDGRLDAYPSEGATWAFFYRQDLFEEAGIDAPPATWDEFVDAAVALTRDTTGDGQIDQWGFGHPVQAENAVEYWATWLAMAGSPVVEFDGERWVSDLDSPEALAATQFMVDLVQTHGVMPPTIVDMDWEAVTNGFIFGNFAMMWNGSWVVGVIEERAPELDGQWAAFLPPAAPGQESVARGFPTTFHVMQASPNKAEATAFLNFFYTQGPEDDGVTYADRLALAANVTNWTDDFLEYAREHYPEVLQPFVQAVEISQPLPMSPAWQQFAELYGRAAIQDMLQGRRGVEETLQTLHERLDSLHAR